MPNIDNYVVIKGKKYQPIQMEEAVICEEQCDLYDKCKNTDVTSCFIDIFDLKSFYVVMKEIKED